MVVGGPVASGKSTLAAELASRLEALHVGSDEVGAQLPGEGLAAFTRRREGVVYEELLRRVAAGLAAGRPVVVDGCFSLAREREGARSLAERSGAAFLFVECRASEEVLRGRLDARDARVGERFWRDVARHVAARAEPATELAASEQTAVHTDRPTEEALGALSARVRRELDRLRMPDAVTFDCWNTLVYEADWTLAHRLRVERLRAAAEEAGRSVSGHEAGRAFDVAWGHHMEQWRAGRASGAREVALWGLQELGLEEPHPALEHLVEAFEEASHSGRVCALDGARETLETLAREGIPCALVCDTGLTPGRVVRRHLERLGLLQGLAVQVFSDEIGVPKPDARAFREALEPLGVAPERALHVGDLRRTDIAGARGVGMRTVRLRARYDDPSSLDDADFVVDSHEAFRAMLAG